MHKLKHAVLFPKIDPSSVVHTHTPVVVSLSFTYTILLVENGVN